MHICYIAVAGMTVNHKTVLSSGSLEQRTCRSTALCIFPNLFCSTEDRVIGSLESKEIFRIFKLRAENWYCPPEAAEKERKVGPSVSNLQVSLYYHYIITYLLTPWSRVLLEKLASLQLVKNFPAFYGTRRFLTALTSARHLSLSWASPIQSS